MLVAAKAIVLAGHQVPPSAWAPFAYFWQDVLVALAFGAIARLMHRPIVTWLCYGVLAGYVAINVPIALELSSPLSAMMLRAARGPLADSVAHGVTMKNVAGLVAVLGVAAVAPWLTGRMRHIRDGRMAMAAAAWVAIGVAGMPHVDTRGLHRNAIGALVPAAVPVAASGPAPGDWRASPFAAASGVDLRYERGLAKGRNVLMISLESTAAQYLGLYGAPRDPMPNVTRLAGRAAVFERMYAAYPESIKGLFATLCSRFPAYGVATDAYADVPCASIAQTFKDDGYRTALFHSGRFEYLDMRSVIDHRGFDVLEDAGAIGGHLDSSFGIDEGTTVDRILGWLDGLAPADRFFVTYLPIEGHHPYATTAPGPFKEGTEFSQYLNALHESDASIGRLLEGLKARGRDRDTAVVIYGDHGEAFGQHEGNRGHTLFIYDENVTRAVPDRHAGLGWR